MTEATTLPAGLVHHCYGCKIVIPSDAPRPNEANCAFVAMHKLAWSNPAETVAAQFLMAVAAWGLIHNKALKSGDPMATAYQRAFQADRKAHYAASAARKAMTAEQVAAGLQHKRDAPLYRV